MANAVATPVIEVKNLTKSFAGVKALDSVDLTIMPGEIHCLAGENGSGKSTLIKILSGVYEPDSGDIWLNNRRYRKLTPIEAIHNGIQVIYQDFSVFPNLSVMENLAMNTELAENKIFVSWSRMRKLAQTAVGRVGFSVDLDTKVGDLSVADKQLVAISRALLHETRLIIMDEPTTALTSKEVSALFSVILDLKAHGIATLFVSHKLREVFEISERFTILRNGKRIVTTVPSDLDHKKFASYMTGRDFEAQNFVPREKPGDIALEVVQLGLTDAFEDLTFNLRRGEVLGITGLLGSGRTELALTLCGALQHDSGQLMVDGEEVHLKNMRDAISHGIAYVPEDRLTEGLMLERSIADNLSLATLDTMTGPLGVMKTTKRTEIVKKWIGALKIATPNPENAANTLSGGNQQRVVLAKWVATHPDILILNGPTVGVDIGSKAEIHRILRDLAEEGMGIIVISDDISEIRQTCNRVLLLTAGRISKVVNPEDVTDDELSRLIADDSIVKEGAQHA